MLKRSIISTRDEFTVIDSQALCFGGTSGVGTLGVRGKMGSSVFILGKSRAAASCQELRVRKGRTLLWISII